MPRSRHACVPPHSLLAWNIPGYMLSVTIAYQVFRQENPQSIEKVKAVLDASHQNACSTTLPFHGFPSTNPSMIRTRHKPNAAMPYRMRFITLSTVCSMLLPFLLYPECIKPLVK